MPNPLPCRDDAVSMAGQSFTNLYLSGARPDEDRRTRDARHDEVGLIIAGIGRPRGIGARGEITGCGGVLLR
jgi:hypothetical protein